MQHELTRSITKLGRLLSITVLAWALTVSMATAASTPKFGFIDVQKAISSTKDWKNGFAAFKASFQKQKSVISQKEEKIKKMLEDLNKQSFVLDPTLKKQKEDDFRKEKVAFERYVEDQNNEFGKKEKEMTQKLLLQMIEIVQAVGKDRNYSMILEKKSVLYLDEGNDITDLAVKAYDLKYK
ncbi:MAG: OmpH family outer membrane protein [Nitrospinae bacterium]|jgi:outer membrane protein|nr:OmpH family outer membrane protein [Nitrospinota bacterium]MDA1110389.1 OmpH family outer membrane protein [Nitrospinota bacterium]